MESKYWSRIKTGDQQGLKLLYDAYFEMLYRFGLFYHTNEAEVKDAIHNIFLRIWEKRETITTPSNTKNYLMTSLRNEINQSHRKLKKVDLVEDFKDVQDEASLPVNIHKIEKETQQKYVSSAIKMLSPKNRIIIDLKFKDNLTNEEIAEYMGINYQSVRNLLHRAIKQLRKKIQENEYKP